MERKMEPKIVRTRTEIDRVLNWAFDAEDQDSHFPGMSYESGIIAMYEWLTGAGAYAPDEE